MGLQLVQLEAWKGAGHDHRQKVHFFHFHAPLDGATATVRNARWRKVICAESLEARAQKRNSPPEGRAARPAEPGDHS